MSHFALLLLVLYVYFDLFMYFFLVHKILNAGLLLVTEYFYPVVLPLLLK